MKGIKNIIQITKIAGEKLQHIAKTNNTSSLLFYVKGGGCNGFKCIYLNDLHGYVLPHARNILDNEINLNYFDYVFTIE